MMDIAAICFTKSGYELLLKLSEKLQGEELKLVSMHHKCKALSSQIPYYEPSIQSWAVDQFAAGNALLFIGATGIAVRAIASSVKNKLSDSPVLVMDEKGTFIIPLLSGHMGGANVLATSIALATGAIPVITTATDIQDKFSVDEWAKENHLSIINKEGIAKVSSKALRGEKIRIGQEGLDLADERYDVWILKEPLSNTEAVRKNSEDLKDPSYKALTSDLLLYPKDYIIGIGCKKGKPEEEIKDFMEKCMQNLGIHWSQVRAFASIDVKREEAGILSISKKQRIPFETFTKEELSAVPGNFHDSEFVKSQVGVGNVCERAAMCLAISEGKGSAELLLPKQAENGITIAIAKYEWRRNLC